MDSGPSITGLEFDGHDDPQGTRRAVVNGVASSQEANNKHETESNTTKTSNTEFHIQWFYKLFKSCSETVTQFSGIIRKWSKSRLICAEVIHRLSRNRPILPNRLQSAHLNFDSQIMPWRNFFMFYP